VFFVCDDSTPLPVELIPVDQAEFGVAVADGGQFLIQETPGTSVELDRLKGANGFMNVGNLATAPGFAWADLRTGPPFLFSAADGSRIAFSLARWDT
jgi:hypothetical protein